MLTKKLKIGIVCPYGWDTPGGVQNHVRDLAEFLIAAGHKVSVLAPATDENQLPDYVVSAGKPISIPYNGAVARVLFGPIAYARVRQWIASGEFDLLHLHEPAIPSISLLACWAAEGPMVGTFHAAAKRQKVIFAIGPILEPAIEKLSARIAVSEAARLTLTDHLETDAVVVPNGIYAKRYSAGIFHEKWAGNTIGFIGRFEEPRKGLQVLVDALPIIARFAPDVKVFVAGPGDPKEFVKEINPQLRDRFEFLGRISEQEKADFMSSVSLYVAPNTGGESFGIILAEALAGGACVVASDIPAFDSLLGGGEFGALFESENSIDLAKVIIDLLRDENKRKALASAGKKHAQIFDWDVVAEQIFSIYEMAIVGSKGVSLSSDGRTWGRFLSRDEEKR
ncbi:MAG: glycosyltransferase family 1 protein [Actinobacteria bacterium]|jgi:phosphatidylinositol alpha-mannosyltransferase|nr:glycosyltransferase family 1 protein [Actinomycetota bacterium]NCZ61871.1 glycosyltransferase family 1 protein [Actinomycetota bacterium]NDE40129.1 glycosyltransferase family 1 protein [Actinomycetota bacterium]NDF89093.1 glycosyltransferase family 1 protein [Actinomycetota bacterium]